VIERKRANWTLHILLGTCIEVKGRRSRRCKQLLDDLEEKRRYCKLKKEAPDRNLWRTRFGRGYGPVVRQTAECIVRL
jgi:hypothetical protein